MILFKIDLIYDKCNQIDKVRKDFANRLSNFESELSESDILHLVDIVFNEMLQKDM